MFGFLMKDLEERVRDFVLECMGVRGKEGNLFRLNWIVFIN